jgi:ceramide glucosyltransferase
MGGHPSRGPRRRSGLYSLTGGFCLATSVLIEPIRIILAVLTVASIGYCLAAIFAARRFFPGPPVPAPPTFPPVSILIPLCGADFRAYENYVSLIRQDYPELQIVFGVREPRDPSISLVRKLQADFPRFAIDLVVSADEIGQNPKVNNLNNMLPVAHYDILVLLDSDIRVGPDFLRTVVSELDETKGGLVTCLYRAGEAPGTASRLEAVGITAEFAPGVLVAETASGISFAFGAAIALAKNALHVIGGFPAIADYLADDYMLGNLAHKTGLRVKLSHYIVETVLSRLSFRGFIKHQIRWARGIRACSPCGHTGSVITNATVISSLHLLSSGFSPFAWLLFLGAIVLRMSMALFVGVRCLGDRILEHNFLLVPLRDLFSFFFWCAALCGKRVEWRQEIFRLERNGKMKPFKS